MNPDGDRSQAPPEKPVLACAGETMVMFVPDPLAPLATTVRYRPTAAGAESNVASWAAMLGIRSAWVSRVGADPFGHFLRREVSARGVDTDGVTVHSTRATAVAFKEVAEGGTTVRYYRSGSAASTLDESDADRVRALEPRMVHLTGITASLSPSSLAFCRSLTSRRPTGATVSFDVNWRPSLWEGEDPCVLLEIAQHCDIVFVGEDEAVAAWGAHGLTAIRKLLPDVATLVVKQGSLGATVLDADGEHFVSALTVDVVEEVGAGDAFAAGFLAGTLQGLPSWQAARLGTLAASAALRTIADVGLLPETLEVQDLLGLDDPSWRAVSAFRNQP